MSGCKYLYDAGLIHLEHVKSTLKELDISHCSGISEAGLCSLYILKYVFYVFIKSKW